MQIARTRGSDAGMENQQRKLGLQESQRLTGSRLRCFGWARSLKRVSLVSLAIPRWKEQRSCSTKTSKGCKSCIATGSSMEPTRAAQDKTFHDSSDMHPSPEGFECLKDMTNPTSWQVSGSPCASIPSPQGAVPASVPSRSGIQAGGLANQVPRTTESRSFQAGQSALVLFGCAVLNRISSHLRLVFCIKSLNQTRYNQATR